MAWKPKPEIISTYKTKQQQQTNKQSPIFKLSPLFSLSLSALFSVKVAASHIKTDDLIADAMEWKRRGRSLDDRGFRVYIKSLKYQNP
jgi:hypothetical protein